MLELLKSRAIADGIPALVEEALELNCRFSTDELRRAADAIRRKWCGNEIHSCSIVNARSGRCREDCIWCAQSGHHATGVKEYDYIAEDEMMLAFHANRSRGVSCFSMVTSGRKV